MRHVLHGTSLRIVALFSDHALSVRDIEARTSKTEALPGETVETVQLQVVSP